MLRHLGLIAACACIVASVGCDGGPLPPTAPTSSASSAFSPSTVSVEFGGRVVNADAGGPVANVRVSVSSWNSQGVNHGTYAKETATSGGEGTFTLTVTLPRDWERVGLKFTGPAGYDDTSAHFARFGPTPSCGLALSQGCWAAADRPAIRMYPTLVIRPGESIDVRVDHTGIVWCGTPLPLGETQPVACRRVLVEASPGDSVELEVVSDDSSKPMALGLAILNFFILEPDMSVTRLMVPPGGVPYVLGDGTATLTARR